MDTSPATPGPAPYPAQRPLLPPLRHLGLAFLLVWAFGTYYTGGIGGLAGFSPTARAYEENPWLLFYFLVFPTVTYMVPLLIFALMERRPHSEAALHKLFVGAQAATALGTPLLFVPTGSLAVDLAVFSLGAVLTGFGGMALWLLWGMYYAAIPQEETEHLVPLSAALGAAVLLVVSATSGWVGLACISAMPLASAACFAASWRSLEIPPETPAHESCAPKLSPLKDALKGMVRAGVGLCTIALFWQLLNQLQIEGLATLGSYQIAIAFSIAFTLAVAFVSLSRPRHVSMPSLYRWICPALALGCVTTAWLGGMWGETVTLTLLIGVRFAYCMSAPAAGTRPQCALYPRRAAHIPPDGRRAREAHLRQDGRALKAGAHRPDHGFGVGTPS